jgi:hypothetical protein
VALIVAVLAAAVAIVAFLPMRSSGSTDDPFAKSAWQKMKELSTPMQLLSEEEVRSKLEEAWADAQRSDDPDVTSAIRDALHVRIAMDAGAWLGAARRARTACNPYVPGVFPPLPTSAG